MPKVIVIINQAQHPIDSPRIASLIDFIVANQEQFGHDNGAMQINYKGDSMTIEPSFIAHIKTPLPLR